MTLDDAASRRQHASDLADRLSQMAPKTAGAMWHQAVREATLAEREACAKIAEAMGATLDFDWATQEACERIAAAIRGRS